MTKLRVHTRYKCNAVNPPIEVDVVEYVDPGQRSLQQILDAIPVAVKAGGVICGTERIIIEELSDGEQEA